MCLATLMPCYRQDSSNFLWMQALSDFADYVQKQQAKRRHPQDQDSAYGTQSVVATEEHAELDILDSLNLTDEPVSPALKHLFLDKSDDADESVSLLTGFVNGRLEEGHGEALFDLGLEDNGDSMNFDKDDWDFALARLHTVTESLGADYRILMTKNVGGDDEVDVSPKEKACSGKLMIRRRPNSVDNVIETRIAVVGNVDAGKSTMLGVLVKGGLDDGRGKARVNLFRHKHEIESGRTSSVGMEIMGFDSKGEVVMASTAGRKLSWEEIGNRSVCAYNQITCSANKSPGQSYRLHRSGWSRALLAHYRLRHAQQ
jgi:hypothetical protein